MIALVHRFTASLPDWLEQLIAALVVGLIGVALALLVHAALFGLLRRLARASEGQTDDILVARLLRPTRWAFVAIGIVVAARETPALAAFWDHASGFVLPLLVGWIALSILKALVEVMRLKTDITVDDNLHARRRRTRIGILGRIASFAIVFVTIALMLFAIPGVRQVGVTLMASAGLAALAVGAAAQPALKALIAGFQMALTEPIAIEDVVVIDGEWGRIEDIRTTYVIVRLWDQRRLVVPTTRFLEDTFQNWTKTGAELLGTVMLYLDPATDIAPLRAEYARQIAAHPLWDQRSQAVQVTDATADAIEVRLLLSARDGPTLFDLRCAVRESMLDWIRLNQPAAIARGRVQAAGAVSVAAMADAGLSDAGSSDAGSGADA